VGKSQGRTIINIKPLICPISNVRREINVKEWRFVGHLDPKTVGDLLGSGDVLACHGIRGDLGQTSGWAP
jgi:hypothetical protein